MLLCNNTAKRIRFIMTPFLGHINVYISNDRQYKSLYEEVIKDIESSYEI